MPIELLLWDYNGTLTDDLSRITKAVNIFLDRFGIAPAKNEEVACYDGNISKFYQARNINLPMNEISSAVFEIYSKLNDPIPLRQYAIESLESIEQAQILVTKHPTSLIEREIDELSLRKYFLKIYSGANNKAHLFRQICQDMNLKLQNSIVIGDMIGDINDAKLAGNRTIGISGYHPREILLKSNPDFIIDSLYNFKKNIE